MAITNLAPNPCLKTDAGGFYGNDGWARADGLGTGMLRRYVWRGDTATDITCPRYPVTPGKWYRAALQVKVYGAMTLGTALHWYTGGGSYIDPASSGPNYVKTGPDTFIVDTGGLQAPVGAAESLLNVTGVTDKAQATAYIVREFDTEAAANAADMTYFDGDSAGGHWLSGTDGASSLDTSPTFPLTLTLPDLSFKITSARRTTTFAAPFTLPDLGLTFGLIADVSYDDSRGRIRINATGFPPEVVRVVVSRRAAGTYKWTEVRGGRVAVVGGALARTVDDYEFPAGVEVEYRITSYVTAEGVPDVILNSRILTVRDALDSVWVKFIPRPSMNRKVRMAPWDDFTYPDRSQVYEVEDQDVPVVISSPHSSARTTARFLTDTLAERDALRDALRAGYPLFLHAPVDLAFPSLYATPGPVTVGLRGSKFGTKHVVTVPLTEVAPPPLSVVGTGDTWQTVLDRYGSWSDVLLAHDSWRDLIG